MMRRLLGIAIIEWKLLWRSPALWATAVLSFVYTFVAVTWAESYLDFAVHIGSGLTGIVPIAFALMWLSAATRAQSNESEELTESSPLSYSVRIGGEMIGGLLAVVSLILLVFCVDFAWYGVSHQALPRGVPSDLWVASILTLPPLIPWMAISRTAARLLPRTVSYLPVLITWVIGVFVRPPLNRLNLSYTPIEFGISDLTFFGAEGAQILHLHRLGIFTVGILIACVALWPRRGERRGVLVSIGAFLIFALLLAGVALPGAFAVKIDSSQPVTEAEWAEEASNNPRWAKITSDDGMLLLSHAHSHLAPKILSTIRDLSHFDNTHLPGNLRIIEARVGNLTQDQGILLVPESALRDIASNEMLVRHLITMWVRGQTLEIKDQSRSLYWELVENGTRLYIEWRYVDTLMGSEYVEAEARAWGVQARRMRRLAERQRSGGVDFGREAEIENSVGGQVDGIPLIRSDLGSLVHWRGGKGGTSSTSLEVLFVLWQRLPSAQVQDLLEAYPIWAEGLGDLSTSATTEEIVDAYVAAVQRVGAGEREDTVECRGGGVQE